MSEEELENLLSVVIEDTTIESERLRQYIKDLRNELNSLKEIEQLHQEENGKLRVELEQEKEKNKDLQKQLNGAFDRGFISKDKIKAIQGQLCMQLGSYVRDEASPEQERIAGGINIINKILKGE